MRQRTGVVASVVVGLLALPLVSCGAAALRAAEQGDNAKLRAEIARKHQRGTLTNDEARDIARAVAEREISDAKDDATALARLRETRACAGDLDSALASRMRQHDGGGAEAAIARFEEGTLDESSARSFLDDPDDRWRAVGTRTLSRAGDRKRRHDAILDPSPRVRRSAIRAASDAKDEGDIDLLFETARVDPELLLRNEALRATSHIVRALGDEARPRANELAFRLRDLWSAGDDAMREDVAVAWALSPVFENGGREALRVTLAMGKTPGALSAAGIVYRAVPDDEELVSSAAALVTRTINDGTSRDRLFALAVARPEGSELAALRRAAKDDEREIRIPALARLLDVKADHDAAIRDLEAIAGYGSKGYKGKVDDERALEHAVRARQALALAGDMRIQAWIEEDLTAQDPRRRAWAGAALTTLGRSARAAPLLADTDARVRTRTACTILVASK
jgi:hypothetical protein